MPTRTRKTPSPKNALVATSKAQRLDDAAVETVSVNVAIPVALHRAVRIKTLTDDLTLAEAVTAALQAWVK
jgi:hypothetical protein